MKIYQYKNISYSKTYYLTSPISFSQSIWVYIISFNKVWPLILSVLLSATISTLSKKKKKIMIYFIKYFTFNISTNPKSLALTYIMI